MTRYALSAVIVSSARAVLAAAMLVASSSLVAGAADQSRDAAQLEAREHLEQLVAFGPRPSGSEAAARAADYLGRTLAGWGWEVVRQDGVGTSRQAATAGRVTNVIGWLPATGSPGPGGEKDAVLLSAHYDSVVDGPGAMDNAASVAAVLVTARRLAEAPTRARPAIVLFTDGEERYLLGADLFVRESPLADRVGAIVNLDHSGRAGPLHAFELAAPNGGMLQLVGSVAGEVGNVRAWSFAADVYRLLPFDTDFTVFRALEVPGVNLAFTGDGYAYHTELDASGEVPAASLATLTETVSALAQRLVVEGEPPGGASHYQTFFSLGDRVVAVPGAVLWGLAVVLVAMGLWVVIGGFRRSISGMLRSWLALVLALPLAVALLTALAAGLRAAVGYDQVAYAEPWPFLSLLAAATLIALLLVGWIAGKRADVDVRLAAVTAVWLAWSATFVFVAPGSAAFFLAPLAGLVAGAVVRRRWTGPGGTAATVLLVLVLATAVWAGPLGILLPLLASTIPKAGPEPLLFWPAFIAILGVLLGGLLWFAAARREMRNALSALAVLVLLVSAGKVLLTPPYDAERPQRVWRFHVTGGEEPYQVLAAVDRLTEVGATPGSGPELDDLFWIDSGWWRAEEPAGSASPRPRLTFSSEGDTLMVEVVPPPGSDLILLQVPREGIEDTMPPAETGGTGQLVLRWVVEEGKAAQFSLTGAISAGTDIRAMSVTPGIRGAEGALSPERIVNARTISYTDAPVPAHAATALRTSPPAGEEPGGERNPESHANPTGGDR